MSPVLSIYILVKAQHIRENLKHWERLLSAGECFLVVPC